ncbi:MAG TPA: Holliday junction branch migration protein RuvA [Dehalococcoidia bacterium]|nr:Holliday junction branch migration protein RuvA [Dehalococcoidia bacterium]
MSPVARLEGEVVERGPGWLVVQVGGIGLQVMVPLPLAASCQPGDRVSLRTHLLLRDDGLALYGFASAQEQELFEALLGVSGVGPRSALALLSALGAEGLAQAIEQGDAEALARAPGVGPKLAGRIVLELRGKLVTASGPDDQELVAALQALGYSREEARQALRQVHLPPDAPLEERLRAVLSHLAR